MTWKAPDPIEYRNAKLVGGALAYVLERLTGEEKAMLRDYLNDLEELDAFSDEHPDLLLRERKLYQHALRDIEQLPFERMTGTYGAWRGRHGEAWIGLVRLCLAWRTRHGEVRCGQIGLGLAGLAWRWQGQARLGTACRGAAWRTRHDPSWLASARRRVARPGGQGKARVARLDSASYGSAWRVSAR